MNGRNITFRTAISGSSRRNETIADGSGISPQARQAPAGDVFPSTIAGGFLYSCKIPGNPVDYSCKAGRILQECGPTKRDDETKGKL